MTSRETSSPPSLLVVGLRKKNFHRTCNAHECCGALLNPGMVVQLEMVKFPTKGGNSENAVEVWCRILSGGRPPSPSAHESPPRCKVGWLERDVALTIGPQLDGKCCVVHSLLTDCDDVGERRLSNVKNGAARVFLVAKIPEEKGSQDSDAPASMVGGGKRRVTPTTQ